MSSSNSMKLKIKDKVCMKLKFTNQKIQMAVIPIIYSNI